MQFTLIVKVKCAFVFSFSLFYCIHSNPIALRFYFVNSRLIDDDVANVAIESMNDRVRKGELEEGREHKKPHVPCDSINIHNQLD